MNNKEIIVSGMRATGKLHIGNYLGALRQFLEIQEDKNKNCYFFIADLHALTTPFKPEELRKNELEIVSEYLAAGIDPKKSTFFLQSHVQEHTELAWIFNCITPLPELERMTQFKDKSATHKTNINAGLLTYPTLMAADILLYKANGVPVGEDQVQHVELSRIVARKFNNAFGSTFPEPKTYERKPLRIQSLKNPEKKMSKTADDPLYISDNEEEVKRKIKKAVTGSDGHGSNAGVDNLMSLLAHFGTIQEVAYFTDGIRDNTIKFSELKETVSKNISDYFNDFREKKNDFLSKPDVLAEILAEGAKKARKTANETMLEVKEKIGLL